MQKLILFLFVSIAFLSCGSDTNNGKSAAMPESKTIKGIVQSIDTGKDGYTAKIQTDTEGLLPALVSIVNLGGIENYQTTKVGDRVVFTGSIYKIGSEKMIKVDKIVSIENTRTTLLISENSFRGIKIGDKISGHNEYAIEGQMRSGEGSFKVHWIMDFNNNRAGYLVPDPKDELIVGNIMIQSKMAETAEGIKVGSTFGDLQKAFPNLEVHGSEIEGHTFARANKLSYRLEAVNNTYKVDVKKIPLSSKVTQIMINR